MKTPVIAFLLFSLVRLFGYEPVYSDDFHKHYPVRGRDFDMVRYDVEAPVVTWDELRRRKATVVRTRGDKYPYEEARCVITIEGRGLETPRVLSATGFRTVEVSWITGKLMLVRLGIGHIAAVEAVYDVEKDLVGVSRISSVHQKYRTRRCSEREPAGSASERTLREALRRGAATKSAIATPGRRLTTGDTAD